jgi:hypothetical protein
LRTNREHATLIYLLLWGNIHARKRELIEPHPGDKRYVRRDDQGRFKESDDVSWSLSRDVRQHAKQVVKPGQGDKGDQKRR